MVSSSGTLSGWGRVPVPGREKRDENLHSLTEGAPLCRGLGRAYGDSALPAPGDLEVAGTTLGDRILAFDDATGALRAEAGISLRELNRIFLPRNWFTPVTPGTQFVTLGGMVAADVHGKNHHVDGCFGEHVLSLKLRVGNGSIVNCSPEENPELFFATLGGMGLTGHILEVEVGFKKIPSSWIFSESERIPSVDSFVSGLKEAERDWPFTVGWIDCLKRGSGLGRGILFRGRWCSQEEAPGRSPKRKRSRSIPFVFPGWVLGRWSIRCFNFLYFWKHLAKVRREIVDPETFYYPLDSLLHWNRIYGPRGFTQYQCLIPDSAGPDGPRRFMDLLTSLKAPAFLGVIKNCGPQGRGLLSFPMPGISIAVDIKVTPKIQETVDILNRLLIELGGRVYLAKDAFSRPQDFRAMEPRLDRFLAVRDKWDPDGILRSAQSTRLFGG